jgi:hypothetical protein
MWRWHVGSVDMSGYGARSATLVVGLAYHVAFHVKKHVCEMFLLVGHGGRSRGRGPMVIGAGLKDPIKF